jgi:hypothetical protein
MLQEEGNKDEKERERDKVEAFESDVVSSSVS